MEKINEKNSDIENTELHDCCEEPDYKYMEYALREKTVLWTTLEVLGLLGYPAVTL